MRARGTHACTIAEIANPSTSAHQTSHAISTAFQSPSPTVETMSPIAPSYPEGVSTDSVVDRLRDARPRVGRIRLEVVHITGLGGDALEPARDLRVVLHPDAGLMGDVDVAVDSDVGHAVAPGEELALAQVRVQHPEHLVARGARPG